MSQKSEPKSDKWRDLAEQEIETSSDATVDDEHLLPENDSDNKLTDKINVLENQIEFLKDQATRALASVENMHRRMEQEVSKARKFGVERIISDMIPVVDSLIRGLEGVNSDDSSVQLLRKGMELTLDIMNKLLEKNGVLPIEPKSGDVFDPTQHEAMSQRHDENVKAHTILQVLQKGYALHGRVIRAAMVIVAS